MVLIHALLAPPIYLYPSTCIPESPCCWVSSAGSSSTIGTALVIDDISIGTIHANPVVW